MTMETDRGGRREGDGGPGTSVLGLGTWGRPEGGVSGATTAALPHGITRVYMHVYSWLNFHDANPCAQRTVRIL